MSEERTMDQTQPIGIKDVQKALTTLQKYKEGKVAIERRIVENERWWKLEVNKSKNKKDRPTRSSAWLFNSIINKHADAMDNFPAPNFRARERSDTKTASDLSKIVPVLLEQANYEETYDRGMYYKLKMGGAVYGAFWNPQLMNGLGDVDIQRIDVLNLFWDPRVNDLNKSRNLFCTALVDNEELEEQYPQLKGKLGQSEIKLSEYAHDNQVDTSEMSLVVDWYYLRRIGGRSVLHLCKFVGDEILFASENDPDYQEKGFYWHGRYPFVMDPMFPVEDSPFGFGFIDIMRAPQEYIDRLDGIIMDNSLFNATSRWFRNGGSAAGINMQQFLDPEQPIVDVEGGVGEEHLRKIDNMLLPPIYVDVLQNKISELKETSGNRDWAQGGTAGGVTSGTAIGALIETSGKPSRDMMKASYRAFRSLCQLVVELIRQFYDEARSFRIIGPQGNEDFMPFSNAGLKPQALDGAFGEDGGERLPIFDIDVRAKRSNPFSTIAQNERAEKLFGMGFFNPAFADQALSCLEIMDFEGREAVMQRISENGTLYQQVQQLQEQMQQMAAIIDAQNGSSILNDMSRAFQQGVSPVPGRQEDQRKGSLADQQRERVAQAASIR